jgi:acetolactate synthase small subunit
MDKARKQIWEQLKEDIGELGENLQSLLLQGAEKGNLSEENIITEIDDMDGNIKILEKFYDLADKLGVKIITIEEVLEAEIKEVKKESKL